MLIVIVAQITDNGHAVILYLKKTITGKVRETLYQTDFDSRITWKTKLKSSL
ncbi:MAG: hypothetical protein M3P08_15775 [Thermoproteota archaeon]|jgi:hypothetical protein|nr:hypothetical protein [Thermoproteota archaeon]